MPRVSSPYEIPDDLVLGTRLNKRIPEADQKRQRAEVKEILSRLRTQPGVILADEVGMGKTFVALAIAHSVAVRNARGPVIVMVPPNLVDKWEQDLSTFAELYLDNRVPRRVDAVSRTELKHPTTLRYGVARHSIDLMRLLDDVPRERAHLIFLAQGAMTRRQSDKWIRIALIAEALRVHGRGKARRLIRVKEQIHRFLAELLWAIGEQRSNELGQELWRRLLRTGPESWRAIYNQAAPFDRQLADDPVPKSVLRALRRMDLKGLAEALEEMPVRAVGGQKRVSERVEQARVALREVEKGLWKKLLIEARWRSPLLVMDEAHHLKNPTTGLARQLQSTDSDSDLRTGDGAMAGAFDRMLFLTATPFQLGHHELKRVLDRFGDVRWDDTQLGDRQAFSICLSELAARLTDSQRAAIGLQRAWSRLCPDDCDGTANDWWSSLLSAPRDSLNAHQRAVIDAFQGAKRTARSAQEALRPWVVRHNKGTYWAGTCTLRRQRLDGAAISSESGKLGLPIPPTQLLPFFLAARSAVWAGPELLGEALCSSYEAFRFTRQHKELARDDENELVTKTAVDLSHSDWYLAEFDQALTRARGAVHPKIAATVMRAVDLWEAGEKVLVFAFYRRTCRALRIHISEEIEARLASVAQRRFGEAFDSDAFRRQLDAVQKRFFDDPNSRARRALDEALGDIFKSRASSLRDAHVSDEQRQDAVAIMRRFLRVSTTLVRSFPLKDVESIDPHEAINQMLDRKDESGATWRQKFEAFIDSLGRFSAEERRLYLEAAAIIETGTIRVEDDDEADFNGDGSTQTLPNVQVATGTTRRSARARLMRGFNTPFFPDILVCSEVMGEGVDLQRFCRHVIHHDLAWNPSTIEQRTGRIDRLGSKAEGRHPIVVYVPYLAGTSDERQYQVMTHREQWFRVVMGQDEVARLITPETAVGIPLPEAISSALSFKLGL
jgi:ERCC4-related helicase